MHVAYFCRCLANVIAMTRGAFIANAAGLSSALLVAAFIVYDFSVSTVAFSLFQTFGYTFSQRRTSPDVLSVMNPSAVLLFLLKWRQGLKWRQVIWRSGDLVAW